MIVKFPAKPSRRIASRRPRRSKNGTPEERAAKAAEEQAAKASPTESVRKQRPSKNGTPEERAARVKPPAVVIDMAPARARRIERAMAAEPQPMTKEEFAAALSQLSTKQVMLVARKVEAIMQEQPVAPTGGDNSAA